MPTEDRFNFITRRIQSNIGNIYPVFRYNNDNNDRTSISVSFIEYEVSNLE